MNFNVAVNDFLDYVKVTKSNGTFQFYKQYSNYLLEYFNNKEIESIDKKHFTRYITHLKENSDRITNATLNKHLTTFKSLYKYTTEKDFKFSKLSENKKLIQTVSDDIIRKIFKYYEKNLHINYFYRNYVFLRLLLDTGLRMNELINLKIKNIDFRDNSILVQVTKTDTDRFVVFTDDTAKHLKKFIAIHVFHEYLFYDFDTGNKMTVTAVETMIARLKKRLDIKQSISPHKWRHTFATRFTRRGGNLEILRLILGHTNLKTTQKYLHLNKEDLISSYNQIFQN